MKYVSINDLESLAKDLTLLHGVKHRCIDATQIYELPTYEPPKTGFDMCRKDWFTMIDEDGAEDVIMTDKLVCYTFNGEVTIVKTVEGLYSYPGDQRRNIEVAIGKAHHEELKGGEYCRFVKCPWLDDEGECRSPNDMTTDSNGVLECDYNRGILPKEVSE